MKNNMINNYKFEYDDENYKEEIKKYINISNNKKKNKRICFRNSSNIVSYTI